MSIFCNFFLLGKYCKLRILRKRAYQKSSKSRQKQGIDLQPLQIFKTTWSMFYFRLGIGNSFKSFQRKFIVPMYLRIGNETFPVNPLNLKGMQLSVQFKNSRILYRKAKVSLSLETRISLVSRDYKLVLKTFD